MFQPNAKYQGKPSTPTNWVHWKPPSRGSGSDNNKKHHDPSKNAGTSSKRSDTKQRNSRSFVKLNHYKTIEAVIHVAFDHKYMPPNTVAAVWHRLSRILSSASNHDGEPLNDQIGRELNALITRTVGDLHEYGPIQLCQTALSMGKIIKATRNCGPGRSMKYRQMFRDVLICQDTKRKDRIFEAIAYVVVPLLPHIDPQGYSNLAYACAIADVVPTFGGDTLFGHIADAVTAPEDLRTFKPQGLSNIVWAFATSNVSHTRLFDKVAYEVIENRQLSTFEPQALSNMLWAYAKARVSDCCLFEKVADEVASRHLRSFNPQALSNIVWAYARAGVSNSRLFDRVAYEVIEHRHLNTFTPQGLSNIVWAFATAEVSNPRLFNIVADEVEHRHLGQFNLQGLSNIVWACAASNILHPSLFDRVAGAIMGCKDELVSQNVSNILWAYATVGLLDSPLFTEMIPRVKTLLHKGNSQYLASIAWSYAVANVDAPTPFDGHFLGVLLEKMNRFSDAQCCQLYQWHLWQKEEKGNTGLPPVFQERCYEAFTSTKPTVSALQRDVVAVLHSIGLTTKEEQMTQWGFSLDATVEMNGQKVGVEVDGPSHFIGSKQTGSTLLKRRQIANVEGMKLVSVPYWEWDELWNDHSKKQNYLLGMQIKG